jgi:hypothetical protein
MTPTQAAQALCRRAEDIRHSTGCSINDAHRTARASNPVLVKAMGNLESVQFGNSRSGETAADRRERIEKAVQNEMRLGLCDRDEAWRRVSRRSEFANAMTPAPFTKSGASDGTACVNPPNLRPAGLPMPGTLPASLDLPARATAAGLPADCAEDEVETAEKCTMESDRLDALIKLHAKKNNVSLDVAGIYAMGRYPQLAAGAGKSLAAFTMSSSQGKNIQ